MMTKIDACAKCGSSNIKEVEKELTFEFDNPGEVVLKQACEECQECHEIYFDEKQSIELARKLDAERHKD